MNIMDVKAKMEKAIYKFKNNKFIISLNDL